MRVGNYILRVFANALFLDALNVGNSNQQDKNIAEVDATGRYRNASRGCAEGTLYPHAHFVGCNKYTNGVGIKSVCFFVGFPTT